MGQQNSDIHIMNRICRLCLAIDNVYLIELARESDILTKISLCFTHEILIENSLPNGICRLCVKKVEAMYLFRHQIIHNQNILYSKLKDGSLHDLYMNHKKDTQIKKEYKSELNIEESEVVDNSESRNNANNHIAFVTIENTSEKDANETEETLDSNSDDDVSLSFIKNSMAFKTSKCKEQIQKDVPTNNVLKETDNSIGMNISCLTCYKIYTTQNELLLHYNTEHNNKAKEGINADIDIKKCMVTVLDSQNVYKCNKCDKLFHSKRKINRHINCHMEERPFLCKLCGRTYKTASEIVRHGRAHSEAKYHCSYQCGYSSVYSGSLKQHEKRHRTEFTYTCEKCGKGYQVKTWYEQHQNVHNGVKPFKCDICGLTFHMDRYLKAHRSSVHPHSSARNRFICMHCSKPCDSKKGLTLHLKEHGISSYFLCDICGKILSNAEQLKFHKRMHLGDRPYRCGTCSKSFTKKFNLRLHERTHTGERAHACVRCGKRYTQRGTLLRHLARYHKENGNFIPEGDTT